MDNKELLDKIAESKSIYSEHSTNIKNSLTHDEVNEHVVSAKEKLNNIKTEVNAIHEETPLDKNLVKELNKTVQQNLNSVNQVAQDKIKKLNKETQQLTKEPVEKKDNSFDLVNQTNGSTQEVNSKKETTQEVSSVTESANEVHVKVEKPIEHIEHIENVSEQQKDQFELILETNDDLGSLAKWLFEYNNINYKETASYNDKINKENWTKQLYHVLYGILSIDDTDEFTKKFDVVNLAFEKYSEFGFNITRLYSNRFNFSWNNGEYDAFKSIVYYICNLAKKETRQQKLQVIALNKFTLPKYQYNGKVIFNLINYYGV